jgi:hypothetical protein
MKKVGENLCTCSYLRKDAVIMIQIPVYAEDSARLRCLRGVSDVKPD